MAVAAAVAGAVAISYCIVLTGSSEQGDGLTVALVYSEFFLFYIVSNGTLDDWLLLSGNWVTLVTHDWDNMRKGGRGVKQRTKATSNNKVYQTNNVLICSELSNQAHAS